jgi:hypothetical protein
MSVYSFSHMSSIEHPYYPIIYLRGFAATQSEIEATTATPYMGFNLGATKTRQDAAREVHRHIFESPLIRLMKDYGYIDTYRDGTDIADTIPARSVIIHRYYDEADRDFGSGKTPSITKAATELAELILSVRDRVCGDDAEARAAFRVYLVAHSMGGLICRCLLQNPAVGTDEARTCVDKVFTYGTPHNGIELRGFNVPRLFGVWEPKNFNRRYMSGYLALDGDSKRVDTLNGQFPPQRFFCLVGTNHQDYGLARYAVGPMSDGLVKIENAAVQRAPRAFVFRSHSGPYGLVNSEEGYQNLVRFLFGDTKLTGTLEVDALPLPPAVAKAKDEGHQVRVSYYFDCTVRLRGVFDCALTERTHDTGSAIFRKYDELFKPTEVGLDRARSPVLFSTFLDSRNVTQGRTLVLAVDLRVHTTDYEIDGGLFRASRIHGENLFRESITVRLTPHDDGWRIRTVMSDRQWSEHRGSEAEAADSDHGSAGFVELSSPKGFKARLRLEATRWNESD